MQRLSSIPLAALLIACASTIQALAQDVDAGEKTFKKCISCHQIGENAKSRTGPTLNGIIGRPAAGIADFKYSEAMASSGLTWNEETLTQYLKKPKDLVKGTKMSFAGLKEEAEIADVIAYLATFKEDGTRN